MTFRLRWALLAAGGFGLMLLVLAGVFLVLRVVPGLRGGRALTQPPVRVTVIYRRCQHTGTGRLANPAAVKHLTGRPTGSTFGDWKILGSGDTLHLGYEVEGLCPRCKQSRFLGIANGFVATFAGIPGRSAQVLEVSKIQAGSLPQVELDDLERGIPLRDERERLQLLEGLAALINE